VIAEFSLHREGSGHAGPRRGEGREEGVALGALLLFAVDLEGLAHDLVMLVEHPGVGVVAQALEQRRGAFDVGEEEGERLDSRIVRDVQLRCPIILSGGAQFH
jgi:hypothetical protein